MPTPGSRVFLSWHTKAQEQPSFRYQSVDEVIGDCQLLYRFARTLRIVPSYPHMSKEFAERLPLRNSGWSVATILPCVLSQMETLETTFAMRFVSRYEALELTTRSS